MLETPRAVVERDRARGISTDDPVVERMASIRPDHSDLGLIWEALYVLHMSNFKPRVLVGLYSSRSQARDTYHTVFKWGLALKVPLAKSTFGGAEFEWIRPSDYLKYIVETDHLDLVIGYKALSQARTSLQLFWQRFECIQPRHQVFEKAREGALDLAACVPIYFHADEGRTLKKKPVFIMQWQPCCGKGVGRKHTDAEIEARQNTLRLQCNYKGHSLTTRFLSGLMLASSYADNPDALNDLVEAVCCDMAELGSSGVLLKTGETLYLIPIGNKGDWPYLVTVAGLTRSFRNAPKRGASKTPDKPMCHLCMAGAPAYPYEDVYLGFGVVYLYGYVVYKLCLVNNGGLALYIGSSKE